MMPGCHYVDRKLDVTSYNKDYTSIERCVMAFISIQNTLSTFLTF